MPSLLRRIDWATLAKGGLAAGILGYLVYLIEPATLWETARTADPRWIAAAALLLPVNLALEGLVWRVLVRRAARRVSLRAAFASLLCGYAFGIVTPGRLGELAGRAFYLDHPDKWELGTVVLVQRFVDMIMSAAGGAAAVILYLNWVDPEPAAPYWGLFGFGAGAALSITAAALRPGLAHRVLGRLLPERAARRTAFLERYSLHDRGAFLALSALRYGVYTTQFALLALAFAPGTALAMLYVGVALTFLVKFIIPPISLLDIGIREGAAVFFLGALGLAQAAAFNAALLLFALNILLPTLAGVPFVLRMRLRGEPAEPAEA